jgi:hypothetical protein
MAEHLLASRGRLWAWTTQEFPPPSPPFAGSTGDGFVPFGVGYVDLGDVKVETRLTESDASVLRQGMDMELVLVPFRVDDDGNEVVTFAFTPTGGDRRGAERSVETTRSERVDSAATGGERSVETTRGERAG